MRVRKQRLGVYWGLMWCGVIAAGYPLLFSARARACGACDSAAEAACATPPSCTRDAAGPATCCPNCTWKERTITEIEWVAEERQREVTVIREIPEVQTVTEEYVENVTVTDSRMVAKPVVHTVHRIETRPHMDMVPTHVEMPTRKVRVWHTHSRMGTNLVDHGHYEDLPEVVEEEVFLEEGERCPRCGVAGPFGLHALHHRNCAADFSWQGFQVTEVEPLRRGRDGFARITDVSQDAALLESSVDQVWVPDVRAVPGPVTELHCHVEERPSPPIMTVRPVTTFVSIPVQDYVTEWDYREETFTKVLPVTRTRTYEKICYQEVPETVLETYMEWVPKERIRVIKERVCPTCDTSAVHTCCEPCVSVVAGHFKRGQ